MISGGQPWTKVPPSSIGIGLSGGWRDRRRPPTRSRASMTTTDRPCCVSRRAAARPAAPAPIIATSQSGASCDIALTSSLPAAFEYDDTIGYYNYGVGAQIDAARRAHTSRRKTENSHKTGILRMARIVISTFGSTGDLNPFI